MKRLLLAALLLIAFSVSYGQRYKGGVRLGLNASALTAPIGTPTDQIGAIFGVHVGGYGRMSVSNSFRVQVELLYSQRGGEFNNLNNDGDGQFMWTTNFTTLTYTDRLNYIDIPILASFHGRGSSFLVGLQPSFLVGHNQTLSGSDAEKNAFLAQFGGDLSNYRSYTNFDLAGVIGFELELDMGLNFGLRASYGFLNIIDQSTVDEVKEVHPDEFDQLYRFTDFHNVTVQFTVGYTIGGAK